MCGVDGCVIPGEEIIEALPHEAEFEKAEETAVGVSGGAGEAIDEHQDDEDVMGEAPRVLCLKDARAAAVDVLNFLMENQAQPACNSLSEKAREIVVHLQRMTTTSRHVQPPVTNFFERI